MAESREALENSRAHWATRAGHAERNASKLYDKLRRLENKVRSTIVVGEYVDQDALYQLRMAVPAKPRPTLTQLRKKTQRR